MTNLHSKDLVRLESFILEKMIATKLPGLSMVLLENSKVSHRRNFGFRDVQMRVSPTSQTLYGLGSITKVFTAVAIMQLHDQGLLSVDDPVGKYIDLFPINGTQVVCIKHLLSHSSGIPALGYSESKMSERWWMNGYPISSPEDLVTFMRDASAWVQAIPGQRWFYLNEGYLLLGIIIEQVSGQSYEDYVRKRILLPLGMKNSCFHRHEVEGQLDRATPYLVNREGSLFIGSNLYSRLPAAGGLVSCASDMALLLQLFFQDNLVLSAEALALMQTPVVSMPAEDVSLFRPPHQAPRHQSVFGLGLQVQTEFFGHNVIGHGGGVMGGTSYIACIPEDQVGVVLLSNAHGYPMSQFALAALATVLGEDLFNLDYVRLDQWLVRLQGTYTSYLGTMTAQIKHMGDGLELKLVFKHEDRVVFLFPQSFSDSSARFISMSGGRQLAAEFVICGLFVQLIYERYCFRKS